jgi:hypothetical protein
MLMALLAGCASPTLRSDVSTFQRWPADASGATYSFKKIPAQAASLEHGSYEDLARAQLNGLGLKEAAPGSRARFEVILDYGINTRVEKRQEPVWQDRPHYHQGYWRPAHYHPQLGWQPGYWVREPYGWTPAPRVVGYQTVSRDVSTRRLRVDISEAGNKVFEASATSEGSGKQLVTVMPYLVRSVFDGFPGANGQLRRLEFDVDKGQLTKRGVMGPG